MIVSITVTKSTVSPIFPSTLGYEKPIYRQDTVNSIQGGVNSPLTLAYWIKENYIKCFMTVSL